MRIHSVFCIALAAFALLLSVSFGAQPVSAATYPFGDEVVLYHFEDAATATSTNSGTGGTAYDGTFVGAASTTAVISKFGSRSASFGESGDFMRTYFGNAANPATTSISVSFWVYKGTNTCTSDDDHVFGVGSASGRFYIRCKNNTTNKWDYRIQTNLDAYSINPVATTSWDHIVLVADATTSPKAYFYVNGVLQQAGAAFTSYLLPGPFYVGNYNDTAAGTITEGAGAYIDEVAIYNRTLSSSDVTDIYNAGQPAGTISGLAATPYENMAYLSWGSSGIVTDYVIEYKLSSEPTTWTTFSDGVSTTTSTVVTGLSAGVSYDFRVTSKNGATLGTPSSPVTASTLYRIAFVSPTPTNGSTVGTTTITASASTTLPTASFASSTQILRLETALGALVSQVATTTRYGDYNLSHLTNIVAGLDMNAGSGVPANSSGAAYVPTTNTIFIPHNNTIGLDTTISEITTSGAKVARTITCTACGDIEGMTLISSVASSTNPGTYDHTFMVSTENNTASSTIFRITIPSTGSVSVNTNDFFNLGIAHGANSGMEGIAYNSSTDTYYVAREISTQGLFEVRLGSNHTATSTAICTNLTWPTSVTDFSDLAYNNGILYILSENTNPSSLFAVNITSTSSCSFVDSDGDSNVTNDTGDYLTPISIGVTDQAEGVTWDATGDYLYVIGEAYYFSKYRTNAFSSRATFSGLADGNYVLKSAFVDSNGVTSSSTNRSFTVNTDVTAPTITPGSVSVSSSGATIPWTTNENASSSVSYGLTTGYGTVSTSSGSTNHSVSLTGLSQGTLYHYKITATDASGNTNSTSDGTFTTAAAASGSGASSGSDSAAPAPGSMTAVSGPSMSVADLQAIFGNRYMAPAANTPSPAQADMNQAPALPGSVVGSGLAIRSIASSGIVSNDVKTIQRLLNSFADTRVAASGVGSTGRETNYFGPATRAAVQRFQLKFGIVKNAREQGYGVVGPKTRAKMNELLAK